jgi:hypothetical protein
MRYTYQIKSVSDSTHIPREFEPHHDNYKSALAAELSGETWANSNGYDLLNFDVHVRAIPETPEEERLIVPTYTRQVSDDPVNHVTTEDIDILRNS